MIPTTGPFGIGKFSGTYRNWFPYFKFFKCKRLFNIIFYVFDLQGDGLIMLTLNLFRRGYQLLMPFPGNKMKFRCELRLFKSKNNNV